MHRDLPKATQKAPIKQTGQLKIDTFPTDSVPKATLVDTASRIWRSGVFAQGIWANQPGAELGFRLWRRGFGAQMRLQTYFIDYNRDLYYSGTLRNQTSELKYDTITLLGMAGNTGAWQSLTGMSLGLSPRLVTKRVESMRLGVPLHVASAGVRRLEAFVAPEFVLIRHQYFRFFDQIEETAQVQTVQVSGTPPLQTRIVEYYRELLETRTGTEHIEYLPGFGYHAELGWRCTPRISLCVGATGTLHPKDYNVPGLHPALRQSDVRIHAGVFVRLQPQPIPAKRIKPKPREVIRL